jgi:hypothetical protein
MKSEIFTTPNAVKIHSVMEYAPAEKEKGRKKFLATMKSEIFTTPNVVKIHTAI